MQAGRQTMCGGLTPHSPHKVEVGASHRVDIRYRQNLLEIVSIGLDEGRSSLFSIDSIYISPSPTPPKTRRGPQNWEPRLYDLSSEALVSVPLHSYSISESECKSTKIFRHGKKNLQLSLLVTIVTTRVEHVGTPGEEGCAIESDSYILQGDGTCSSERKGQRGSRLVSDGHASNG